MCCTRGGKPTVFRGKKAWKYCRADKNNGLYSYFFRDKPGYECLPILYADEEVTKERILDENKRHKAWKVAGAVGLDRYPGIYATGYKHTVGSAAFGYAVLLEVALYGPGQRYGVNFRADTAVVMAVHIKPYYTRDREAENCASAIREQLKGTGVPVTVMQVKY